MKERMPFMMQFSRNNQSPHCPLRCWRMWWSDSKKVGALILALVLMLLLYYMDLFRVRLKDNSTISIDKDDVYATTAFCGADGICGESPTVASPRTIYSANSAAQHHQWMQYNDRLNEAASAYAEHRRRNVTTSEDSKSVRSRPMIILGDSIAESWVGTSLGVPTERAAGVPEVLRELVQEFQQTRPLDPLVLGISGDQTQHLLWRLQQGHLHPEYADHPDALFVVLIGTNNLGSGELPGPTADGIIAVLQYLLDHTQGTIIYFEVLPRGDDFRLEALCPPRCQTSSGQPYKSFLPAIDKLNDAVHQRMDTLRPFSRVWPVQCGADFLIHGDDGGGGTTKTINASLMPDRLHPNVDGHRILANCIKHIIG